MLEHEILKGLEMGDQVEIGPFFPALTKEPIKGEVVGVTTYDGVIKHSIEYTLFGIPLMTLNTEVQL